MSIPNFYELKQDTSTAPIWTSDMRDGEFISYAPSYKTKIYFDLFDKYVCPCAETGDITYYVYDPVKHGAAADKKYPVLMWLHGMSNSLDGVSCIMCCGAEQFASTDYQREMGGAYLIVPLANEKRMEDGSVYGAWNEENLNYSPVIKKIYDTVCEEHKDNIGKKFVMGASAGGFFTWKLLENYIGYFDAAIPMATWYVPPYETLDRISEKTTLLIAHGRHDEMADFTSFIYPHMEKLRELKNCICFFPEWIYNGDGGIASVNYGMEMGQHCIINWVQSNLIFDNGKPADERLPLGITGWIKDIAEKSSYDRIQT